METNNGKKRAWFIGAMLLLIIFILLVMFLRQYQILGKTIEDERGAYVSEIKNQLVKNIKAEKDQQISLVSIYGQVLTDLKPRHFTQISSLLSAQNGNAAGDEIFLMDKQGSVYTLDKEQKTLSEQNMIYELTVQRDAVFGYSQVNQKEEFWIYGAPIEPLLVDGIEICAVINARSVKNFGERMSTSILDNNGFSYIMSKTGNVLVFPSVKNTMGYNLFGTLEGYGVSEDHLVKMKNDFLEGNDGKQVLSYNGNKWLLDYSGDMFDDWVVVITMPMTVMGADTYKVLNVTMRFILFLFGSILLFMLYVIRRFYLRERLREQAIQREKAELVIAQKIAESKNEFLAKMSHDIRTPLNAIIGLIQITSNLVMDRPKAVDNLQQAGTSAEYLLSILNDILDMSKIESGKMEVREEPFDLCDLVDSLMKMNLVHTDKKNIEFKTEIEGEPAEWYLGDKSRISQIMMNLLSNAVKFTPPMGHIWFHVKLQPESTDSDRIIFQVKDDGVGMSQEYQKHLFQPFEQETETQAMNYCGSGLGLSIVKNLVDLMNGTIDVESEKDAGSCFTVVLCLRKTEKPLEAEEALSNVNLKGKKVLLAEDNDINAMIAKELLETSCEMVVETVENGLEAVEEFGRSMEGCYDVILMDIRMPVMDGLESTRRIRELSHPQAKTIPIIAMSANAFDEDIARAMDAGMNAYLSKPIDMQKVIVVLKKTLKGQQQ